MHTLSILLLSLSSLLFPAERDSIELIFAGDAMQHESQLKAARQPDGTYSYADCYAAIKPYIQSADYAVVNLETPLGGAPYSGYPMFCAPDSYLTALKDAGFDLFLTANNHVLDRRDKGLRRTIDTIHGDSLPCIGSYRNKAERDTVMPFIRDIHGFKVAFLNYTYGTNGITIQKDAVVDYIDRRQMQSDIARARESGAEIVVTCVHWGDEYKLLPNASQRSLADYLIDIGADIIIGGHPHVIQPMEMRYSPKHDKNVFLCYSLGNLISAMRTPDTRGGALARIVLTRDENGKAIVSNADYRMVFVVPPALPGENFKLIPAETDAPGRMQNARRTFVNNARRIFDRHNINVPADTLPIGHYIQK